MRNFFDLELVIADIEAADDLIKTDGLPAQQNVFDPGEHNGRFVGDLPGGTTISGQGSVVVDGSVYGSKSNPCRILVKGDLVVTGDIEHTHIRCRQFFCRGNLQHTQIKTQNDAIMAVRSPIRNWSWAITWSANTRSRTCSTRQIRSKIRANP